MPSRGAAQEASFAFPLRQAQDLQLRKVVPIQLGRSGIEADEWAHLMEALDTALREKDDFYDRPCTEFCFYC